MFSTTQKRASFATTRRKKNSKHQTPSFRSPLKAHGSGATPGWATLVFTLLLASGLWAAKGADNTYTIAVIPKGTTHEFWKSINAGAFKARDELAAQGIKLDVIWKGPLKEDEREAGFLDVLKKQFPKIKLISSDQYAGPTRESGYQASQNLLNRFGREVDGIFCPCEPPTIAMGKALRDLGLAGGKVKMVGFDAGSQSVTDMKHGDVQGLVVQNPLLMGYLGVMTAVKNLRGEKVEKRIDTGVVLVTPENMNEPEIK